jgi:hypothetical protein
MLNSFAVMLLCVTKLILLMHITLNIQTIIQYTFIALMAIPLPLLLLSSPLRYVRDKITNKRYYNIVRKHHENPSLVSAEQLRDIFPGKKSEELNQIVYSLQEANEYRDH